MAKMLCTCGNVMSNSMFPNTMEGDLKGSYEYTERDVWECAQCGRLHIDIDDPNIKGCFISKIYFPEDGVSGNLFGIASEQDFFEHLSSFWEDHKTYLYELNIIQDKEPILNKCIQELQEKIFALKDDIDRLLKGSQN